MRIKQQMMEQFAGIKPEQGAMIIPAWWGPVQYSKHNAYSGCPGARDQSCSNEAEAENKRKFRREESTEKKG